MNKEIKDTKTANENSRDENIISKIKLSLNRINRLDTAKDK